MDCKVCSSYTSPFIHSHFVHGSFIIWLLDLKLLLTFIFIDHNDVTSSYGPIFSHKCLFFIILSEFVCYYISYSVVTVNKSQASNRRLPKVIRGNDSNIKFLEIAYDGCRPRTFFRFPWLQQHLPLSSSTYFTRQK